MSISVDPAEASPSDVVIPIVDKIGVTLLPEDAIDPSTKNLTVAYDPTTMQDHKLRFSMFIEYSSDGGQTWNELCRSTHVGGIGDGVTDGIILGKNGKELAEVILSTNVIVTKSVIYRSGIESLVDPITTSITQRKK